VGRVAIVDSLMSVALRNWCLSQGQVVMFFFFEGSKTSWAVNKRQIWLPHYFCEQFYGVHNP